MMNTLSATSPVVPTAASYGARRDPLEALMEAFDEVTTSPEGVAVLTLWFLIIYSIFGGQ